tara:strand:- start:740 stop:979 length:240 start_codon:yes stop_codon:yes gene_type:complete
MPEHYDADNSNSPPPSPKKEPKKSSGKMTDKQKADLNKHMKNTGLTGSEAKSHRMKMMTRMRKGMSVTKAHNDIKKSSK